MIKFSEIWSGKEPLSHARNVSLLRLGVFARTPFLILRNSIIVFNDFLAKTQRRGCIWDKEITV
jgi:hypothetical protein